MRWFAPIRSEHRMRSTMQNGRMNYASLGVTL
jgi:hypothetical protein